MVKAIPRYRGYYSDEDGVIYSDKRGALNPIGQRVHRGYKRVNLKIDGRLFQEQVHKLVLFAFVGERPDGMVCRHLNGNAFDNSLSNLCWGTPQENVHDAIRHGTAVCLRHGERHVRAKLRFEDVLAIRKLYADGYLQRQIGERYGVTQRHVSAIVRGETWQRDLAPHGRVKSLYSYRN